MSDSRVKELEATFDPEPQDWEQARHHNADKYIAMKHLALQLESELDRLLAVAQEIRLDFSEQPPEVQQKWIHLHEFREAIDAARRGRSS